MVDHAEPGNGQTCFIVGPIGSALDLRGTPGRTRYEESLQMWEQVFEPACESLGLRPIRADKIAEPGEIPEQIYLHLRDSPVVIADVTEGNPNVMYELGLRHTRDLVTVQVGEYARLPFDISSIRTLQFRRTEGGLVELRDALIDSLRAALHGSGKPVTATRVWNELGAVDSAAITAAVAASTKPDEAGGTDEPGFMDVLAEGEAAVAEVTEHINRVGAVTQEAGGFAQDAQVRLQESDARNAGFAGRLLVARELAVQLAEPATEMEDAANDFNSGLAKVDAMMQYIVARAKDDPAEAVQAAEFLRAVVTMVDSTDEAESGIRQFLTAVIGMRKIARDLAPVSKTMERALNQVLKGINVIQGWRAPMREVLDGSEAPKAPRPDLK